MEKRVKNQTVQKTKSTTVTTDTQAEYQLDPEYTWSGLRWTWMHEMQEHKPKPEMKEWEDGGET